ncbi:hypothetical protein BZG36_01977 [Bifiguratus adelaidae]|uniref:Uncharacterized protein n=1 Tax=Bifiguratus adelaidae TaxID=1938954 RepID=A0A261Y447_9FUNG|nr:hypothetical protein BZG36_01977 [Bifiguratus adelaidae]
MSLRLNLVLVAYRRAYEGYGALGIQASNSQTIEELRVAIRDDFLPQLTNADASRIRIYKSLLSKDKSQELLGLLDSGATIDISHYVSGPVLWAYDQLRQVLPEDLPVGGIHILADCTTAVSYSSIKKPKHWSIPLKEKDEVLAEAKRIIKVFKPNLLPFLQGSFEHVEYQPPDSHPHAEIVRQLKLPQNPKNPQTPFLLDDVLAVVLGTSGSGKTRTMIELLCRRYGFYFSASVKGERSLGASDLATAKKRLADKLGDEPKSPTNDQYAEQYINCLLVARVFVLHYIFDSKQHISAEDWVYFQLLPSEHGVLFDKLIENFRALSDDSLQNITATMLADLSEMTSQYRFPTIVDEAMALITDDEVFTSRTDSDNGRPLYSIMIRRLMDYKNSLKFTASDKMDTETNIKDQHVITISEGFDSEEEVQRFLQQNMLPASVYCCRSLIWLVGRFAFAAGFVQAWAEGHFGRIVDDAILAYKDELVNTQPIGGGMLDNSANH